MTLNKAQGRMFQSVGWTWNPIAGCTHECPYCYARSRMKRWGKTFDPQLREHFFKDKMPDDGSWIFVGSMGDIFCDGVPPEWIDQLLEFIEDCDADNKFLLQTKNIPRVLYWKLENKLRKLKDKIILGTTIETNRKTPGIAPPTKSRWSALTAMRSHGYTTFLSLEPLADFTLKTMTKWIGNIGPEAVEIGLENYGTYLPKPPEDKILALIENIKDMEIPYILKENLRHLEESTND